MLRFYFSCEWKRSQEKINFFKYDAQRIEHIYEVLMRKLLGVIINVDDKNEVGLVIKILN